MRGRGAQSAAGDQARLLPVATLLPVPTEADLTTSHPKDSRLQSVRPLANYGGISLAQIVFWLEGDSRGHESILRDGFRSPMSEQQTSTTGWRPQGVLGMMD